MVSRIALGALLALCFAGAARGGELEQQGQLQHQAAKLYRAESFAELDRLFDEARTKSTRTDSGLWRLWLLHQGVVDAEARPRNEAEAAAQAQRARRWLAQNPASVTAPLVRAEVELRHARALGCGPCTVVEEGERPKLYAAALEHARDAFDDAKPKSGADPQWYADMVELGRLQRWAPATMDAFMAEAEQRAPGYYTLWFNAVDFALLHPDKAPAQIDALARRATAATRGKEGASLYARVWWYAAQVAYGPHLFTRTPVSWKDFDAGIRDVMARYPDDWNRNNLANFACNAKHPERARELMRGFEPLPEGWDSFEAYVECVQPQPQAPSLQT